MSFVSAHRFGASLEVPDTWGFGSSLSLRSFSRVGSSVSVLGVVLLASCRPDGFVAVCIGQCFLGIVSLFLRSFARLGASLSVLEARPWVLFIIVGSSRVGDSLSLFGSARCGSSLAVLGYTPGFSIASLWNAIGRVAFRLIFLPDRVLDGNCGATPASRNFTFRTFCPWLSFRDLRIVAVLARHIAIRRILICDRLLNSGGIGVFQQFPRPWRFACSFRRFMSRILGGFEVCVGQLQRSVVYGPLNLA